MEGENYASTGSAGGAGCRLRGGSRGCRRWRARYGIHRDMVRCYLAEGEVEHRRRWLTAERQAQVVELYQSGITLEEVGDALRTSKWTVGRVLNDFGVERRLAARRRAAARLAPPRLSTGSTPS